VQVAVETEDHLIIAHEVPNSGSDRAQLANMAEQAKNVLQVHELYVVADRGYYNGPDILNCEQIGVSVTLPKPMTSGAKADGRFGRQDFYYLDTQDAYRCPAGQWLTYRFACDEDGKRMRVYWTNVCGDCPLRRKCTTVNERRIKRWEHEHVLEVVQEPLDANPNAMRERRESKLGQVRA